LRTKAAPGEVEPIEVEEIEDVVSETVAAACLQVVLEVAEVRHASLVF
jgi:hypothetical protein